MNEDGHKQAGRFIPTLTEVIGGGETAQIDLQLPPVKPSSPVTVQQPEPESKPRVKPAAASPAKTVRPDMSPQSVANRMDAPNPVGAHAAQFSGGAYPSSSAAPVSPATKTASAPESPVTKPVQRGPVKQAAAKQVTQASLARPADEVPPVERTGTPSVEPVSKEHPALGVHEVFSPLARNPAASPDSLRPSDLMLVALSERIAAKARARIEENVEQHIHEHIFPLLDSFAEQLVLHIQDDLIKIMREGIAEATREELDQLRQRH